MIDLPLQHDSTMADGDSRQVSATASRGLASWLTGQRVSLVVSTHETAKLIFIGTSKGGDLTLSHAQFSSNTMGIAASPDRIILGTHQEVWHLENALPPEVSSETPMDRLYMPRKADATGYLNLHELGVEASGRVVLANTEYSCLATVGLPNTFLPIWKPSFITDLVPEDRCHLNGIAFVDGRAKFVTTWSATDYACGWRENWNETGMIIDIESDRIVADGLSMPHSPRFYRGAVWVLESGSGNLLRIDPATGRREIIVFCPGFVRGLAFHGDFAVATLSKRKPGRLIGETLVSNLERRRMALQCGIVVIDLIRGEIVEWMQFGPLIPHLFDCAILEDIRQPGALSPLSPEVKQ